MGRRRVQSLADMAAIGLAPILIFVMLSSLASFVSTLVYKGQFPARVSWTLLMYTMGTVALARVTIENDRKYAMAYATGLGAAALVTMLRFFGDPIFSVLILAMIGILADRITHDCTIIDDSIDGSDRGLIDQWVISRNKQHSPHHQSGRGGHQPGRTVLWLALAALPLFGLGQFFLRSASETWTLARWYLALYLFSSLSLLVVTAFLNLRRYLRQRDTEMPRDATIAWLAGGIVMLALILAIAYLAPLPGQTLASLETPDWLKPNETPTASRYGWGKEGAQSSGEDDAQVSSGQASGANANSPVESDPESKSQIASESQPGGRPGGNDGQRKTGPGGKQPGDRQSGGQQSGSRQSGGKQAGERQNGSKQTGGNGGGEKQSGGKRAGGEQTQSQDPGGNQANKSSSGGSDEGRKPSNQSSGEQTSQTQSAHSSDNSKQTNTASSQRSGGAESSRPEPSNSNKKSQDNNSSQSSQESKQSPSTSSENARPVPSNGGDGESTEDEPTKQEDGAKSEAAESPRPESSQTESSQTESSPTSSPLAGMLSWIGGLFRLLLFTGLALIAIVTLIRHLDAIFAWWHRFIGGDDSPTNTAFALPTYKAPAQPPKPFSSFQNPVDRTSPDEAIIITFEALQAWSRERGLHRHEDETPSEFAARLASQFPSLRQSAPAIIDAYNRIVYGRQSVGPRDLDAARLIWQSLQRG